MRLKSLQPFSLVGGTALSLRYGHRTSVDLDLFSHKKFDQEPIVKALKKEFGKGYNTESKTLRWGIFCYLNDVKVDIVYHPHLLIGEIEEIENIRMYPDVDIIAMKLNAILGRGKKKDFWDLFEWCNSNFPWLVGHQPGAACRVVGVPPATALISGAKI